MAEADKENKEVEVVQDEGNEELLDEYHKQRYNKLLMVCDHNMNLDGRKPNHNQDFTLIRDNRGGEHVEPTRNFCLKAVAIFELNYEPIGEPTVIQQGEYVYISRDVKVSKGERYVIEAGGASTEESKSSGARAFHDALGRAMTRGMKRGLEALIGLPFVNMMIKELFGRYNVAEQPRDVSTPNRQEDVKKNTQSSKKVRETGNRIYKKLKDAADEGYITSDERNKRWNRVLAAMADYNQLVREESAIDSLIEERRA